MITKTILADWVCETERRYTNKPVRRFTLKSIIVWLSTLFLWAPPHIALAFQETAQLPPVEFANLEKQVQEIEELARNNPANAVAKAIELLDKLNPEPPPVVKGRILNGLSYAYSFLDKHQESMKRAKQAQQHAIKYGLTNILARANMLQGNTLQTIGEYDEAIKRYHIAAKHYADTGNTLYLGYCYNNMGNTYRKAGLLQSALEYYLKYKEINNEGSVNKGIGDVLLQMGRLNEAFSNYEISLEQYRNENDTLGIALIRNSLGDAHLAANQAKEALASFSEAYTIARRSNIQYSIGYSMRGIAESHLRLGNLDTAHDWIDRALSVTEQANNRDYIVPILELKADIYEAQENLQNAFDLLKQSREKQAILDAEKSAMQLSVMQALYESEAKAAEIEKLEEQNKILQLERTVEKERSQYTQLIAFTLVCALVALGFWIYTVSREKRRLAKVSAELEKAKIQAEQATQTKSAFLANMSHEIRTPLTSIIGYADSILQGDIPEKEEHRVLNIISDNGNHLLNVISDILDFTKIEANKLEFEHIPTPLFPLLAQIESVTGKRARDKGLSFDLHFRYPLPSSIVTDPTRLRQILFNLTNNALKFTDKGSIGVSVKTVENKLHIAVRDTGIGINKQQLDHLFQPFQQADGSINRRFGGSGLGLSISRHLAQGLGGELSCISEEGKGSEFIVTIDLQPVADCRWITSKEEAMMVSSTAVKHKQKLPVFAQAKVLLAEDHPNNRELIKMMLTKMGLAVTDVENGLMACNAVAKEQFDLIFLDIQMPVMDGLQALKQIRKSQTETPVIALTANNMKHEIEQYMREGFVDHLPKPLPREALIAVLDKYLQQSEREENCEEIAKQPVGESIPDLPGSQQDMVQLIRNYSGQLQSEIEQATLLWQEEEWEALQELAHSIKGSAANFGFGEFGDIFNELEQTLKDNNTQPVSQLLNHALGQMEHYQNIPGTDMALGIHNHSISLNNWYASLSSFSEQLPETLAKMQANAQKDILQLASDITTLQKTLLQLALPQAHLICTKIRKAIRENCDNDVLEKQLSQLCEELHHIKEFLKSS